MNNNIIERNCRGCQKETRLETIRNDGILQCSECKTIQNAEAVDVGSHFKESDKKPSFKDKLLNKMMHIKAQEIIASQYIHYLKEKTGLKLKTALDIGCQYGVFVRKLSEYGVEVEGIESNKSYVDLRITDYVKRAFFDTNLTLDKKYDLIAFT